MYYNRGENVYSVRVFPERVLVPTPLLDLTRDKPTVLVTRGVVGPRPTGWVTCTPKYK